MARFQFLNDGSFVKSSTKHQTDFPEVISIDTQIKCNLKCEYCHPHTLKPHLFPLDKQLSMKDIRHILEQVGTKHKIYDIRPFQNGDPLFEPRLTEICDLIWTLTKAPICVYTSGTMYKNRRLLRHPHISTVFFTISAATRETYEKVHGGDLFDKAVATLRWLTKHKYPEQEIGVTLIVTRNNIDEIPLWHERFKDYPRLVAPLHSGYQGPQSLNCLRGLNPDEIVEKYGTYKGFLFGLPCTNWNEMMISVDGQYLICSIATPETSLGDIHKVSLETAWKLKLERGMNNPVCQTCNMKAPNYKELLEDWKPKNV